MAIVDEDVTRHVGGFNRRRVDRPAFLNAGLPDVEGPAGIQERRRYPQHLQEHAKAEGKDETNGPSSAKPVCDVPGPYSKLPPHAQSRLTILI